MQAEAMRHSWGSDQEASPKIFEGFLRVLSQGYGGPAARMWQLLQKGVRSLKNEKCPKPGGTSRSPGVVAWRGFPGVRASLVECGLQ